MPEVWLILFSVDPIVVIVGPRLEFLRDLCLGIDTALLVLVLLRGT
jgi:hypothetical protein